MKFVIASFLVLGMFSNMASTQSWGKIKVGEPFPSIELPSLRDGKPMSIAHFRGKKVILQIFASW